MSSDTSTEPVDSRLPKYAVLADFVDRLIENGTLLPGTRAPSLRSLAHEQGVSLSTVLQAYGLLEARGVLEARPRSGYYVLGRRVSTLSVPTTGRLSSLPRQVRLPAGALALVEQAADPALVPLGCAIPSPDLLDARRLDACLARVARLQGEQHWRYGSAAGERCLREALARRCARHGQLASPDDIVLTAGCTEALNLAIGTVARPGDTVVIESPTYFGLLHVLAARGLKAVEIPTRAADGIDPEVLNTILGERAIAACVFASSFSNPLGYCMSETRKRAVLDVLGKHRVPLIEDDLYGDLHFESARPRPFAALDSQADVIYCSAVSKMLAPGYRIGWVISQRHRLRLLELKVAASLSGAPLPQVALAEFLATGGLDAHLRRLRAAMAINVDQTLRAVESAFPEGTRVTRPDGGFVLWLALPRSVDTRELYRRALDAGICFAPGDLFSNTRRYRHCLRLSCGHAWDARTERAVRKLGRLAIGMDRASR